MLKCILFPSIKSMPVTQKVFKISFYISFSISFYILVLLASTF